jgi:hypothetical protein
MKIVDDRGSAYPHARIVDAEGEVRDFILPTALSCWSRRK